MKWKIVFVLSVLVWFSLISIGSSDVYYYAERGRVFTFPVYNTGLGFDEDKVFSSVYREDSKWHFNDYWFSVQNANMTITKFFEDDKLQFSLSGSETQSTTQVYLFSLPKPSSVDGCQSWEYGNSLLTVYARESPDVTVIWGIGGHQGGDGREKGVTPLFPRIDRLPLAGLVIVLGGIGLFMGSAFFKKLTRKTKRGLHGVRRTPRKRVPVKPRESKRKRRFIK